MPVGHRGESVEMPSRSPELLLVEDTGRKHLLRQGGLPPAQTFLSIPFQLVILTINLKNISLGS